MKKSIKYALCEKVLKMAKTKDVFLDEANITRYLEARQRENIKPYSIPLAVAGGFVKCKCGDMDYYTFGKPSKKIIIYFHGGSFVQRPVVVHFPFVKKISKESNCKLYFPIYPLAPQNTNVETHKHLAEMYEQIQKENPDSEFVLMGDSAGGTLCFTFFSYLLNKQMKLPVQIIAYSPCMDSSFSNPDILLYNEKDVMLHSYGCGKAIQTWVGNTPLTNAEVNPIYIDMSKLPDTMIFVGEQEIMYPDIIKFGEMAKQNGAPVKVISKKLCGHCFPLYPVAEARDVITKVIKKLSNNNK